MSLLDDNLEGNVDMLIERIELVDNIISAKSRDEFDDAINELIKKCGFKPLIKYADAKPTNQYLTLFKTFNPINPRILEMRIDIKDSCLQKSYLDGNGLYNLRVLQGWDNNVFLSREFFKTLRGACQMQTARWRKQEHNAVVYIYDTGGSWLRDIVMDSYNRLKKEA